MESNFSSFLWGFFEGKQKKKCKSWNTMTLPLSRQGLGFNDLASMMRSLKMKTAWNLLTSESQWADFMWNKYIKGTPVILNDPPSISTRYWRDIWDCVFEAIEVSRWEIGRGDVSFFFENWLCHGCLCDSLPMMEQNQIPIFEGCSLDKLSIGGFLARSRLASQRAGWVYKSIWGGG